jgi:predicted MPP superfamily phosphohydrolase
MLKNKVFILVAFLGLTLFAYGYYIESNWLEVTHHQIILNKKSKKIIKIIQISDLHTSGIKNLEKKVIYQIQKENPDFIFITGDISTPGGNRFGYEDVLKSVKSKYGTYFIPGNWEDWEPISDLNNILIRNHIIDLTNKAAKLDKNLWLVGFADAPTSNPNLQILNSIPKNSAIISIFHSPIFFKKIAGLVDLAFSGHTHGGQIRLPFIGAITTPPGSDKYDQGWFIKGRTRMYVNRGIGTSIIPIRLMCRPELSVFEVRY